jgi:hypothetical protein
MKQKRFLRKQKLGLGGAKALIKVTYFLTHLRAKFYSNCRRGGGCVRQKKNPKVAWALKDLCPKIKL